MYTNIYIYQYNLDLEGSNLFGELSLFEFNSQKDFNVECTACSKVGPVFEMIRSL